MRLRLLSWILAFTTALAAQAGDQQVVHMLVPGFAVQELPVRLSNLNNLRFAPDGRLFALAYDGRIHVLRDTDGDGLEDSEQFFWDKTTLTVPVGMVLAPEGVYVSSHGRVSLLRDTDGDAGRHGNNSSFRLRRGCRFAGGVDADLVSLAHVHAQSSTWPDRTPLFESLRVKDGVSHYELNGKRGTIQKLARGQKTTRPSPREFGVPYALAFTKPAICLQRSGR